MWRFGCFDMLAAMPAVTLYSKPACPQCNATHRRLTNNGIPFNHVDLTTNPEALAHVQSLGYTSAPVVVAGDDHWSGYRPDRVDSLKF